MDSEKCGTISFDLMEDILTSFGLVHSQLDLQEISTKVLKRSIQVVRPRVNFETFLLFLKKANQTLTKGEQGSYLATKNIFFEEANSQLLVQEPK